MSTLAPATGPIDLEPLRRAVAGTVLGPDDGDWDGARRPWNAIVDQHPAGVVRVTGVEDVRACVGFAAEHGLRVCAQPTGHSATWDLRDTLLLRTGDLAGVTVDATAGTARVGTGAHWREVQAVVAESGLCGLQGTAPHVSVTGYSIGGGVSWLGRRHGLAANDIRSAELVTGDGNVVRADADSAPELFWALRGGGGNFGVVTELEIGLQPTPHMQGGNLIFPLARAHEVLTAWRGWTRSVPDEATSLVMLLRVPPLPTVPEPMRGQELVVVGLCHLADEATARELVAPLRALEPVMDTIMPMGPRELGTIHMDPEDPIPSLGTTGLLEELDDETIDRLVAAVGPGTGSPLLFCELRHLGGAIARPSEGHGVAGHVAEPFLYHALGVPMGPPGIEEAINDSLRRVDEALAGRATGRALLNFIERRESVRTCFSPENLTRLAEIKARHDPAGLITCSHPIAASGGALRFGAGAGA